MEGQLIYSKIPAIMADIEHIGKDRKNQQQGYSFRGVDDMYNTLHRHFANHKVFYTSEVISETRDERQNKNGGAMYCVVLKVKFTFYAEDGSNVASTMIGEAFDSGDKASNKAMSTALKYALMQLLLIPTEEEKDTEVASPEVKPKQKAKPEPAKPVYPAIPEGLLETIEGAVSKDELLTIWQGNKALQTNPEFTAAITKAKEALPVEATYHPIPMDLKTQITLLLGNTLFHQDEREKYTEAIKRREKETEPNRSKEWAETQVQKLKHILSERTPKTAA